MAVDTTASGRFWLCPVCRKHVATRTDKCQCGFDRTTVNVPMQETATPSVIRSQTVEREEPRSNLPWIAGLAVAIAASLWLWKAGQDSARANAELRDRTVQRLAERVEAPLVITPSPAVVDPDVEAVSVSSDPIVADEQKVVPLAPDRSEAPVPPTQSVPLNPESEVDTKRREGGIEFERAMAVLASKADQADVAWERYLEGCRINVTTSVAAAGIADRTWIAWAYASTTSSHWTDACAEAGTFFGLVRQVRSGMCVAEDRARMSWVLPGTRRDIRRKHRLDWDGWDRVCS